MKLIYLLIPLAFTGCTTISQIKMAGDLRRAQQTELEQGLNVSNTTVVPIKSVGAKLIQLDQAVQSVVLGISDRVEVAKRLGKTKVLRFDSNYEVWIYQFASPEATRVLRNENHKQTTQEHKMLDLRELRILFNPAGIAIKLKTIHK